MARRSSSSRWSRPATGKQIAALKARGNYDGKYYSMGRASQGIGGSARRTPTGGRRSGGNSSSGSIYSPLASSGLGPPGLLSRLFGGAADLDSLLQPALGPPPGSPLASSGSGPTALLSQLLGVPDDLEALVQAALSETDPAAPGTAHGDDAVESVLFTLRSDDSDPSEPRIVVEAEVIHAGAFDGKPSLQVRFVGDARAGIGPASDHALQLAGARPVLGYRPAWTPVLVRTPEDLAEQMRVHWREAVTELAEGADPRMATFLAGASGTEAALVVLDSGQSSASKFVLLQGLLDPAGPIQFQGLGLDATTFAEQIRKAHDGDDDALNWLDAVQREQVLTSFAEVTGTSLAAEADFRLARWREQGDALIKAVTMKAKDANFEFSLIRSILTTHAEIQARREENRARLSEIRESNPESADMMQKSFDRLDEVVGGSSRSADYGLLEDWFFEETRAYLRARFRQSLPAQFAAALTPPSGSGGAHAALAEELRKLAGKSSTDLKDYSAAPAPTRAPESGSNSMLYLMSSRTSSSTPNADVHRRERIVQAVRGAIKRSETLGDDDLGTLIVAQEVLGYAMWKRDELRAEKQAQELDRQRLAAAERSQEAQKREEDAKLRHEKARENIEATRNVEQFAQKNAKALTLRPGSVTFGENRLPDSLESTARARIDHASAREVAAEAWRAAAEERERWAVAEVDVAATTGVGDQLRAERDAAVAEQSDAKAELQAAQREQQQAEQSSCLSTRREHD